MLASPDEDLKAPVLAIDTQPASMESYAHLRTRTVWATYNPPYQTLRNTPPRSLAVRYLEITCDWDLKLTDRRVSTLMSVVATHVKVAICIVSLCMLQRMPQCKIINAREYFSRRAEIFEMTSCSERSELMVHRDVRWVSSHL
jgi:hypothetical protein